MQKHLEEFARLDEAKQAQLKSGQITEEEYLKWRMTKTLQGEHWRRMRDEMVQRLVDTDIIAASMINGTLPMVYAEHMNYGMYQAETLAGLRTSFELCDQDTIARLMRDDPEIIPHASVDIPKDQRWNRQKLTSAVTQGILQGDSIPNIAKRLRSVTDMDKNAAIRNARTYTTAAENGGRTDAYKRAETMGIEMEQEWLAALDQRTRAEHRELDGERVAVGKPWVIVDEFGEKVEIRYPGDPEAPGYMIYNCRCTVTAVLKNVDRGAMQRWDKLPDDMSYEDWKNELR